MRALEVDDDLVTEGQGIVYREGYYYLFFSGQGFESPFYHVSVARSRSVTGPYERREGETLLHTDLVNLLITFFCKDYANTRHLKINGN